MRLIARFAIAVAAVLALSGCESVATEAAASQFPTVRCPVYEGYPDCSASTAYQQADASSK